VLNIAAGNSNISRTGYISRSPKNYDIVNLGSNLGKVLQRRPVERKEDERFDLRSVQTARYVNNELQNKQILNYQNVSAFFELFQSALPFPSVSNLMVLLSVLQM